MTTNRPPVSADDRETTSRFPIFVFWIAVQILALIVGRSDLQLTGAGHHAGQWAAQILLITQIGASGVLLWDLCSSVQAAALAFALAFPLTQLAAAGQSDRLLLALRCSAILGLWIAGLWSWRYATTRPRMIAAIVALWVWGSAVMWYLVAEFTGNSRLVDSLFALSPILQATAVRGWTPLLLFGVHAAVGLCAALVAFRVSGLPGRRKCIGNGEAR